MRVDQQTFAAALLDPDLPVPEGLRDAGGHHAGRRFAVYRNNVAVSLTEALQSAFPVVRKLVGAAFFDAMAGVFLRAHPPTSPLMMFYGDAFPDFVAGFEPAAHLGYLPDIARLEQALRQSYHAADAVPIAPETIAELGPEALETTQFEFAPAVALIRSDWPVHGIWLANTRPGAPQPQARAEAVLVTRRAFDPQVEALAPDQAEFIARLMAGAPLTAAAEGLEGLDLGATLALLLNGGALTGLRGRDDDGTDAPA